MPPVFPPMMKVAPGKIVLFVVAPAAAMATVPFMLVATMTLSPTIVLPQVVAPPQLHPIIVVITIAPVALVASVEILQINASLFRIWVPIV
jgi:hypothetical protein